MENEDFSGSNQIVAKVLGKSVTRGELSALFSKVQNEVHWKNPIDKVIELSSVEKAMLAEAIVFFTGSVAVFKVMSISRNVDKAVYRVRAAGYFAAIGA